MSSVRIFVSMIVLGLLAACSSEPTTDSEYARIVFSAERATGAEKRACRDAGGSVEPAGRLGNEHCVQTYADAKQSCRDSSKCLGRCTLSVDEVAVVGKKTDAGRCEENDSPFGCVQEVHNGITQPALCVD